LSFSSISDDSYYVEDDDDSILFESSFQNESKSDNQHVFILDEVKYILQKHYPVILNKNENSFKKQLEFKI